MKAYADETGNEKTISGALALAMHALFFALLVFGVAWQKRDSPPMMAELWSELPAPKVTPPPPPAEPKPAPKVEPKPPPKPVPRVEPKPVPKPVPKADIELREKKEKERKAREKELAEKKKREELARQEALKKEKAQLEALKRQQEKERAEQLAREQDEALRKVAQAEAQARLVDEYKRRIANHIRRFIVEPPGLRDNPEVVYDVRVLTNGGVFDVKLRKTSGQAAWDSAVERAIRRAEPLPLPPDPSLMREFRELNLKFRPKE